MTCTEFADWMGPWLSGELDAERRGEFHAHRTACAACAQALEQSVAADEQVLRAVLADRVDAGKIVAAASKIIARERTHRWLAIAAAALLTLAGLGYWAQQRLRPSSLLASAANDHRVEVSQGSPRRWRTALPEVRPLLDQYGVAWSDVETLLPVGFILEKAKQCRIEGEPTLHLVFNDGTRALSVYVRKPGSALAPAQSAEAATFRRGSLTGVVVATAPGLCAEAARLLAL